MRRLEDSPIPLLLELLEDRDLLSPALESRFLAALNAARADPAAYGRTLGLDLSAVPPSAALTPDARSADAARRHSQDMSDRRFFAHTNPSGQDPGDRLRAAGVNTPVWGESIAAGFPTPEAALAALIIDTGHPDLGHRVHLLAIDAYFRTHTHVGIGIIEGAGPYRWYYTIDTTAPVQPSLNPAWLTALYRDLLGRTPSSQELNGWAGLSREQVVATFLASPEYAQRQVTNWYKLYLNRTPDPAGLAAWANALRTGRSEDSVRAAFASSSEARNQHSDRAYIEYLFRVFLGREPSMLIPLSAQDVLSTREAREHQVRQLYITFLGRTPDPEGLAYFTNLLYTGTPHTAILSAFLLSAEYVRRHSS